MSWFAITALLPLFVQSPPVQSPPVQSPPDWQTAAGGSLAFDVASIKPHEIGREGPGSFRPPNFPIDPGDSYAATGGRFFADLRLDSYIVFAYKLVLTTEQREAMVAGLPKWAAGTDFEIEARAPVPDPTKDQMRLMMQSLLADRFRLRIHFETREAPAYALVPAKSGRLGPKLHPHDGPCDTAPGPNVFPTRCGILGILPRPNGAILAGARDVTMAYLAGGFSPISNLVGLGRPIVDQTELSGRFDFTLEFAPNTIGGAPADIDAPAFADALREELGLNLESTKAQVRTPVIDHIEPPSEN